LTFSTSACAQERSPNSGANAALGTAQAAVVNKQSIPESVLRVYTLSTVGRNLDELTPDEKAKAIDELVNVVLLAQQAEKDGLTASRTLAAQLELQRLQLVARSLATDYLDKNPPTETELQRIYDENLPRLSGQQYKARHILLETKAEAERVIAQLREGREFAALAQEHADGPTGPNGGALDWFTPDSMPKPFADAVTALTVGSYTKEPVQTDFGFHVILLEDTRKQEPPALADIRSQLTEAAQRKQLEEYLRSLREAATISVGP
jgi:peptidyl-prolyl cis-trans isomerase C